MNRFKFLHIFILSFLFFIFSSPALAEDRTKVYFFYGDGCPHCAKEEILLDQWEIEGRIDIYKYEVWHNSDNVKFLNSISKGLDTNVSGVPFTIVGEKTFAGFYDAETTGSQIESAISDCEINGCVDIVARIVKENNTKEKKPALPSRLEKINLPVFGEINIDKVSIPVLTILIAAIDGFNPCAMWVLIFLISLLFGMKDKRKMWILGTVFIFTSGLVYFLFLSAWLNLFLFLGFLFWVRASIGLVALVSGGYHIREWWVNKDGTCKVTGGEKKQRVFNKLKEIIQKQKFWLALGGIIVLAAVVNLVELICSAGLPAVYTQILALADLPRWQHYAYLLLYVFIFMLDDLLIFVIAMITLNMKTISSKYSRWAGLIGGIVLLIIGLLMLFKPEWLLFG